MVIMAKPEQNPNRVVTFLSDRELAILKKISERNMGVPISALIRRAVEEFCKKNG
jgi:hypothetical protein